MEGPWRRTAPRPRRNCNHLPALVLRRPSVSARPPGTPTGVRGSRMRDRRPPAYRCPAVPGLASAARAILMALDSSVLPEPITCRDVTARSVLRPRHCGPLRGGPSSLRAARSGSQSRRHRATPASGFHHRTVMRVLRPGSSCLPGLSSISAMRETISIRAANVYRGESRFRVVQRRASPLRGAVRLRRPQLAGTGRSHRPACPLAAADRLSASSIGARFYELEAGRQVPPERVWSAWLCGDHLVAERREVLRQFAGAVDADGRRVHRAFLASCRVLGKGSTSAASGVRRPSASPTPAARRSRSCRTSAARSTRTGTARRPGARARR
jgi:hypothetical protein